MATPTFIICKTARKLKHMALQQIYFQLINTSLHTTAGNTAIATNLVDVD